ncbi:unnamed protein product, partial [Polarella glacialis]
ECRKLIPVESRRQANFMEEELATIKSSFEDLDPRNQGFVSLGELIMTLGDSHLPVNTREGRAKLLASIDLAREAATAAGMTDSEVGVPGSQQVQLWPVVHLFRIYVREHEHEVQEKEQAALEQIKFSKSEVSQMRKIFIKLAKQFEENAAIEAELKRKAMAAAQGGRRQSVPPLSGVQREGVVDACVVDTREEKILSLGDVLKDFMKIERLPEQGILGQLMQPM